MIVTTSKTRKGGKQKLPVYNTDYILYQDITSLLTVLETARLNRALTDSELTFGCNWDTFMSYDFLIEKLKQVAIPRKTIQKIKDAIPSGVSCIAMGC